MTTIVCLAFGSGASESPRRSLEGGTSVEMARDLLRGMLACCSGVEAVDDVLVVDGYPKRRIGVAHATATASSISILCMLVDHYELVSFKSFVT